jgi:glucose/arabinose dehydrogenase
MIWRRTVLCAAALGVGPVIALAQEQAPPAPLPNSAPTNAAGTACLEIVQPAGAIAGGTAYFPPPCQIEGQPIETRKTELGFGHAASKEQTRAPYHKGKTAFKVTVITDRLNLPWGMQFLPDGKMLVAEKPGALRIVGMDGSVSEPIKNVPAVSYSGDAGLMDVALDPHFAQNHVIYFNYVRGEINDTMTRVVLAKAVLDEAALALSDVQVIFKVNEERVKIPANLANGRILFAKDGTIFLSLGSRGINPLPKDSAQDPLSDLGKIVHITTDGAAVKSNLFYDKTNYLPQIYALGFRTPEGLTYDAKGQMWEAEHGPRGGDELNLVKRGANYGWAKESHGIDYAGEVIGGNIMNLPGMTEPVYYRNPSIGPACLRFYDGKMFPEWKDNAFVCALRGKMLDRLTIKNNKVVSEEPLLVDMHLQIRDMREAADGSLFVLTNEQNTAKLLHITAN